MERLIAARPGVADAALMVVLAYCVDTMVRIVAGGRVEGSAHTLPQHLFAMLISVAAAFVIGFLIYVVGRLFGGVATREQSLVAACWHQLVMVLLLPVLLIGLGGHDVTMAELESGTSLGLVAYLALAFYTAQYVWLLARYTTVVHRFRSEWGVIGVMIGVTLLFSSLLLMVRGG